MLFKDHEIALVTGAARGLGRALAIDLAAQGATVVINYSTSKSAAEETAESIKRSGGCAMVWQADVSDEDSVRVMFAMVRERFRRLDLLVNNAGITADGFTAMMSLAKWEQVLRVNMTGTFLCAREGLKLMMHRRRGSIVNISSVSASVGTEGQANYSAAKAGINALTKTLAREGALHGVRVNAVAPGLIETDLLHTIPRSILDKYMQAIPMKRLGLPEEVAHLVTFLCSGQASYITGKVISVDGGLAPC